MRDFFWNPDELSPSDLSSSGLFSAKPTFPTVVGSDASRRSFV